MIKSPQSGQGKLSLVIQRGVFDEKFWACLLESREGEVEGKEYVMTVNGLLEQKFISWLCQCTNLKVNRVLTCKVL